MTEIGLSQLIATYLLLPNQTYTGGKVTERNDLNIMLGGSYFSSRCSSTHPIYVLETNSFCLFQASLPPIVVNIDRAPRH